MRIETVYLPPAADAGPSLSTRLWQIILRVKRVVSNIFRWFLSFCLPISPRAPAKKEDLSARATNLTDSLVRHEIVLEGRATHNNIKFKRVGDKLHLEEISFPDTEILAHAGDLLQDLLTKEKAKGFTTRHLSTARLLFKCGFQTDSRLSYHPAGEGKLRQAIEGVVSLAGIQRHSLAETYIEALSAIEREKLKDNRTVMDSMVGGFIDVARRPVNIALKDLFILMDGIDYTEARGITLLGDDLGTFVPAEEA